MDNIIRNKIRRELGIRKPRNVRATVDVVEHGDHNIIELRIYEDEILQLPDKQRESLMLGLLQTKKEVESLGVVIEIGGVKGGPPRL